MHKKFKINAGNKIGLEFESDYETESESQRKISTDPNISDANQTKLIEARIEHQRSIDRRKEMRTKSIGTTATLLGVAEAGDQFLNEGKTTRQLLELIEKGFIAAKDLVKDLTTKLLHK